VTPRVLTDEERPVLSGLVADGRTPTAELAARTGLSPRRVRDLVRDLVWSQRVVLRTELKADASGWPICA
jgi:DNA-binding Lrp family transcriptional regulator